MYIIILIISLTGAEVYTGSLGSPSFASQPWTTVQCNGTERLITDCNIKECETDRYYARVNCQPGYIYIYI